MYLKVITPLIKYLVQNNRIFETLAWYLIMLMLPLDKHSQANAEKISGKDNSLFSNLLLADHSLSRQTLNRAIRSSLKDLSKDRIQIVAGVPWTVAIIIDATLHRRSSRHSENSQIFNHGKGFVIGHQWTNIGLLINGRFTPLPPIPFYTEKECAKRKIRYKTEHEKVVDCLSTLSLKSLLGEKIESSEVVVLLDSGYDCKAIQEVIIKRKWDFVASIKSSRTISNRPQGWTRISKYFKDGRRPWKSIRIESCRGKKKNLRQYRYKQQDGYLKDVRLRVKLVCSKRSRDKKVKFLASSNLKVSVKNLILCYRKRWTIEIFHRDIKSFLGMEDAGVRKFNSLHNHVNWVYLAYILLKDKYPNLSIKAAQLAFERDGRIKEIKANSQKLTRIGGVEDVKLSNQSVIQEMQMLMTA